MRCFLLERYYLLEPFFVVYSHTVIQIVDMTEGIVDMSHIGRIHFVIRPRCYIVYGYLIGRTRHRLRIYYGVIVGKRWKFLYIIIIRGARHK